MLQSHVVIIAYEAFSIQRILVSVPSATKTFYTQLDHNGDKAEKKLSTQSLPKFNEKCDKRSTLDEWVILQKMFAESKQIENTFTLWIFFPFGSKCVGCR